MGRVGTMVDDVTQYASLLCLQFENLLPWNKLLPAYGFVT